MKKTLLSGISLFLLISFNNEGIYGTDSFQESREMAQRVEVSSNDTAGHVEISNAIMFGYKRVLANSFSSFATNELGTELGVLAGEKGKLYKVNSINIFVPFTKLKEITFGVNIYEKGYLTAPVRLNKTEIKTTALVENPNTHEGWVRFDLIEHNLIFKGNSIISLENICYPRINNELSLAVERRFPDRSSLIYCRPFPKNSFSNYEIRISMYVEVVEII